MQKPESKSKLALAILGVALILGLLADVLLRGTAWGINLTLWIACLVGGLFTAKRIGDGSLEFGSAVLIAPMVLFGICFAWRDSSMLRSLDLGAIIVAAGLVITRQSAPFWAPSIGRVFGSVVNLAAHCFAGFAHLISRDIDWSQQRNAMVAANARSVAAGFLIAAPLLVLFTTLFVRADAAFENLFTELLHVNVLTHLLPIAIGTWLAGSYLRGVLVASAPASRETPSQKVILGATEIAVALALVNILFAVFVAVQIRYLFGNARMIETTPGMTYAIYARRGFFELVIVALMVLPILLAADRVHTVTKNKRVFRIQALALVGLVLCVMGSAMHRMRLYQFAYGLTELRFYVTAFTIFLALVFGLFCLTVLRDLRGLFAMGTVAIGFAAILILHIANPDRWIAATNIANQKAGRRSDPEYLKTLSADAVPILLANSAIIPRQDIVDQFQLRLSYLDDWRSWNYSRYMAERAIRERSR